MFRAVQRPIVTPKQGCDEVRRHGLQAPQVFAQQRLVANLGRKSDHQHTTDRVGRLGLDCQVGEVMQGLPLLIDKGTQRLRQVRSTDPAVFRAHAQRLCGKLPCASDIAFGGLDVRQTGKTAPSRRSG